MLVRCVVKSKPENVGGAIKFDVEPIDVIKVSRRDPDLMALEVGDEIKLDLPQFRVSYMIKR